MNRARSSCLKIAIAVPVIGFGIAVFLLFNPSSYGGEFNFFPGLQDGIPIFIRSCVISSALIIVYFTTGWIGKLWVKGSALSRFSCYVIAYLLIFAAYLAITNYPTKFPF